MLDLMPPLTRDQRKAMHLWLCQHLEAARNKAGGVQIRQVAKEADVDPNVISWYEQRGRSEIPMPKKPPHERTVKRLERWAKKAAAGRGFEECKADPCILCARVPDYKPPPPPSRGKTMKQGR